MTRVAKVLKVPKVLRVYRVYRASAAKWELQYVQIHLLTQRQLLLTTTPCCLGTDR